MSTNEDLIIYKTKLSNGNYFAVSPNHELTNKEFIIYIDSDPVYSSKIPALLRQTVNDIKLFSYINHSYLKTDISEDDYFKIVQLIKHTKLNFYNLLFGQYLYE